MHAGHQKRGVFRAKGEDFTPRLRVVAQVRGDMLRGFDRQLVRKHEVTQILRAERHAILFENPELERQRCLVHEAVGAPNYEQLATLAIDGQQRRRLL